VSSKLPSRKQTLRLLEESGCQANVIKHCIAVAKLAVKTAKAIKKKGLPVDLEIVEIGALLHDIGRSRTHNIDHVIEGVKIAEDNGLPIPIVNIIRRHVGGGITLEEAKELGWSTSDTYIPMTLEEKVVSYADKIIDHGQRIPVELTIKQFRDMGLSQAAERIAKLHEEITALGGDCQ
jgi:uncharacterized protein